MTTYEIAHDRARTASIDATGRTGHRLLAGWSMTFGATALLNSAIFFAAVAAGADRTVTPGPGAAPVAVNLLMVLGATGAGVTIGFVGLLLLRRWRARNTFVLATGVVGALSAVVPLLADGDLLIRGTLSAMHLLTASVWTAVARRSR